MGEDKLELVAKPHLKKVNLRYIRTRVSHFHDVYWVELLQVLNKSLVHGNDL